MFHTIRVTPFNNKKQQKLQQTQADATCDTIQNTHKNYPKRIISAFAAAAFFGNLELFGSGRHSMARM